MPGTATSTCPRRTRSTERALTPRPCTGIAQSVEFGQSGHVRRPEGVQCCGGVKSVRGDEMISTEAALGMSGEYEATSTRPLACTCGQDLDCCANDHCPRCGCSLHHAA